MTTDVDALSTFLQTGLAQAVVSLLTVVGVAVALLLTDVELALVALAVLPLLIAATVVFRRAVVARLRRGPREGQRRQRRPAGERHRACGWRRPSSRERAQRRPVRRAQRRLPALPAAGPALHRHVLPRSSRCCPTSRRPRCSASARPGSRRATLTPGVLTAFLLYLGLFFAPVQQLSQVFDGYQQARHRPARASRDLLRTPTTVPPDDRRRRCRCRPGCAARWSCATSAFAYAGRRPARAGRASRCGSRRARRVALVGATGRGQVDAGQAARPVLRRRPRRGARRRRRRARATGLADYRHRLGVVPQEPHLFTGDVAANIAYAPPRRDADAEIEAAARAVGRARRWCAACRAASATRSASAGRACPRASASSSRWPAPSWPIPTCCCSTRPPRRSTRPPRPRCSPPATGSTARRTAFVVAHRLATAARADRVVVLHGGRIVEQGPPAELLAAGGGSPACGGPASWSPPRTTRTVTTTISMVWT